ncbi:uncharacterized protein (TIGR03083 family) [Motilibacter rhizosphaerae]|uniref:Uncharacterized protein (TIGR03083 family) n=1 Tax=Motilibacter rhizosphaerae TaxID=598652 RepID=A0A4Q7NAT2_9ACTN|nr:maleylpyruvate isomerase family mycothiol-dependent enzyme [Motilibacter rhizosphaerae]RZS79943.1 uncharacterized protein (TIGR03083 family) [Motilibacter rhizosphaerae]
MDETLPFVDLLQLMDERSAAFREAVGAAPDLGVPVPTCPGWSLADLVQHLCEGRRRWAATVAAGPAVAPPALPDPVVPQGREALLSWFTTSTEDLLDALRDAGPDRGCWTWWGTSQSPPTAGAVARHQLQQVAVHTYDAQVAVGMPRTLPEEVALDGVDEFLSTCVATTTPWPHDAAVLDYHAVEGRSWRTAFSADGARTSRLAPGAPPADASVEGTAHELVMLCYGRISADALRLEGDGRVLQQLIEWEPDD